ncbi:VTT domain-containing protein [Crenobacter sp. SG2303]|uniref:VTT domain-containing protein n=1 Tax=Crenobacter oryzisoli TaxID=3056844 RepID=A0ABT7XSL3_9NEIS|nr:VTT domain-containing protein [Crenobacter sp. SG2303]MDN0076788.1 VTT domain-containing protein [Crenobacter sp. SG2303]
MFSGLLGWLSSEQGMMALLVDNWQLGCGLIALVVFLETGLVMLPFLPGDSMLFAAGAFLGVAGLSPLLPVMLITAAAIAGDATNYAIGRSPLGQQIVRRGWVKPAHLAKTRRYFDRFGGPTVSIGRFLPVLRSAAPFLAGLSGMDTRRFALFNCLGAVLWCGSLMVGGYWLGSIGWIQHHLGLLSVGMAPTTSLVLLAAPLLMRGLKRR